MISVIIPVSIEDFKNGLLDQCMYFIEKAKKCCPKEVETIAVINPKSIGRVNAKNYGATEARGKILVFIDVDCKMSSHFLTEISEKARNPHFIGGGTKNIKLSRYSTGILTSILLCLVPYLLFHQITIGAFWIKKEVFTEIDGFREKKFDDLDFAVRLKKYAEVHGKKFESIKQSFIVWNTRKFSTYGDWHWLRSRGYRTD